MLQTNEKIIQARVSAGLSQEDVAQKLGISRSTYQYWEEKTKDINKLRRIAEAMNLPNSYFIDENFVNSVSEANEPLVDYVSSRRDIKTKGAAKGVPVYGGYTTLGNIEVYDDENLKNQVVAQLPADVFPGCDYSERAKGDSMYPLIMNQALLVGKKCTVKGITFGEKYIIKTKDGLDTTKYIHPGDSKESIKLKAYNKSIPDQEIDLNDVVFACRVHWIINPT